MEGGGKHCEAANLASIYRDATQTSLWRQNGRSQFQSLPEKSRCAFTGILTATQSRSVLRKPRSHFQSFPDPSSRHLAGPRLACRPDRTGGNRARIASRRRMRNRRDNRAAAPSRQRRHHRSGESPVRSPSPCYGTRPTGTHSWARRWRHRRPRCAESRARIPNHQNRRYR
jgi:hypothetical protein